MDQKIVDYVKQCREVGMADSEIRKKLLDVGWAESAVNEALSSVPTPSAQNYDYAPSIQAQAGGIKYAGFWIRWVANFLDGIIVSFFSIIPVLLIGMVLRGFSGIMEGGETFARLIVSIIGFAYFIILTYKKGATWGKMALGIKVIPSEKEQLSLGQVFLRETVGKFVSGIIFGIGYIMAGFTEKKEALHDKIAKTNVIYTDPSKKNKTWVIVVVLIAFFVIMIGILASIVLVSLNSARTKAKAAAFKAEVSALVPSMIIACDENNIITINELGNSNYFDPGVAFKNLQQDCGPEGTGHFSITVSGINDASSQSAVCTENGCDFK